jgi:flagellar biosynthetic protein FlhB
MSDTSDADARTEEPTARKLERARERGDVPKTQDLGQVASLAAVASVVAVAGGMLVRNLADKLIPFLSRAGDMTVRGDGGSQVAHMALMAGAPILVAVMAAAALAGVAGNLVQTGFLITPERLKPDFGKLNPMSGFKRVFGLDGLIHFAKSLVKVAATVAIAWWVLKPHVAALLNLAELEPSAMLPFMMDILKRLVFAILGLMVLVAGADWFLQRQRFMARMRMTKEELKEDYRQSEGDPHVKAKQKQKRAEAARRRMMQAVPTATVVIANPTHFAVALKYEQGENAAPICVAKGVDSIALKIREIAEEAGVPVVEDPPLARALYAAVEIDDMIPQAHYEAVAKIIGFILNAGRRAVAKAL